MRSGKETVVPMYYMYNYIIMDGIGTMRVYMPPPHTLAHGYTRSVRPGVS